MESFLSSLLRRGQDERTVKRRAGEPDPRTGRSLTVGVIRTGTRRSSSWPGEPSPTKRPNTFAQTVLRPTISLAVRRRTIHCGKSSRIRKAFGLGSPAIRLSNFTKSDCQLGRWRKGGIKHPGVVSSPVLSGPVCQGIIGKYAHFSLIFAARELSFSAVQTAWRRGRDSNPRYSFKMCKSRRLCKLHGINNFQQRINYRVKLSHISNRCGFQDHR